MGRVWPPSRFRDKFGQDMAPPLPEYPPVVADERIDSLFELPPDEFTPARNELAAELRAAGEREAAAEVKGLRRPTVPAWVVNQLARRHRAEVQELLAVGRELREAQRSALSGRGAEELAAVGARRRRLVDRLVERAASLLGEAGRSSARATLDRVAETLLAASVDQEAAEAVAAGRLERELSPPSGFEAALDAGPAAAASTRRGSGRGRARDTKAKERAERRAREAREAAQEARREARRLAQEAESAERAARRARQRAERAEQRAEEAERKAEELLSRR